MEQVIFGGYWNGLSTTQTEYNSLAGGGSWWSSIATRYKIVSTDGTIKKFRVKLTDAAGDPASPGAGATYTFTLMLNGAPTALAFAISNLETSGANVVDKVVVTGGDYVYFRCTYTGAPTARFATWTLVFAGDVACESLVLGGTAGALDKTVTEYAQVMGAFSWLPTDENDARQVVPTDGILKDFYVKLSTDPGTAPDDGYRFTVRLEKATVAQSLIIEIFANNTTGNDVAHNLVVAAGDVITMMIEPLNGPSAAPSAQWGMTFVADIDGESIVLGGCDQDLDDTDAVYQHLISKEHQLWLTDEFKSRQLGQVCTLKKLYVLLYVAPGAGNKYDFILRKSDADSNVITTISGAATAGNSGVLEDTVALDEYVNLKVDPDDTPVAAAAYWGIVSYIAPPISASLNLPAEFVVLQWAEDLPGEFVVNQWQENLPGEFIVRQETSVDLPAGFDGQTSTDLLGEFIVRHSTTLDLAAGFVGQTSVDLLGEFIVRHSATLNLAAEFVVNQWAEDLFGEFIVRQETSVDLPGEFVVRQETVDLAAEFIIHHTTTADLPALFWINYYGVSLFAEFYVRQTATRATDFTIIDTTRGLTIHDPDREMTVTPRRRMRVK